jgi:lipopolysaccharide/colanic/teichoic acid biosynthesis glycosyltransferase
MIKLDATGDPRLILGGKFLRATGLDELPQIFNVLKGEMSLVGPRPCTVGEFECYAPEQRARVNALPGLTGQWQVNGKNRTTFRQMIEMDIFYSRNISLSLDLKIILRTLPAIVGQLSDSVSKHRCHEKGRQSRGRCPI